MSNVRRVYNAAIFLAAIWAIIVTIVSVVDAPIYFYPVHNFTEAGPPVHRFEVLRLSLFLIFAYFALLHIMVPDKQFSAGHILITMLTCLVIVGVAASALQRFRFNETGYLIAFGLAASAIFFASRPRVRRYFTRR